MKVIRVLVLTFAVLSSPSNAQETLTPARWMTHLTEDLLPFWMHPDALDDGSGMYPSMRCNDGSKFRRDAPCREIASVEWMTPFKNYVIAISRQAYAYGVAFHMTGDPVYLAHARRGVDVLMAAARDRDAGGHFEGFDQETGEWGPKDRSITLQKQAYALLGPAFYYYLTRDPAVLEMIRETRQMILRDHFDPATGFYTRFRKGVIRPRESTGRLVSYLDQLNTYYQQIAPLLAGEERADWIGSMAGIAAVIRDRFHVQKYNAIITNLDRSKRKPSRFPQSDFG
ncbi:MAG: AGE family epimerase/isomerase, partial [Pseudomonadota bacterium]